MKEMYINCLYPDSYLWAIKVNCNRAYKIKSTHLKKKIYIYIILTYILSGVVRILNQYFIIE